MTLLTIFTAPKPFTNSHINIIQRNAIQSWLHLGPQIEVFLMGDEDGMARVAGEYDVRQFSDVRRNEKGTPLVSSMFDFARRNSQSPILVCVNADILFLPDLLDGLENAQRLTSKEQSYLLIGQRWDLDVPQLMDYSDGWEDRLRAEIHTNGQLHAPAGSDFFAFPRGIFAEMPDFAIGRAGWDNWMIYQAKREGWPVIDGTPSVTVVHQSHDYSHLPDGRPHYELPESHKNQDLAGGANHMYMILDSDKQLRNGKLQSPPLTLVRSLRQAEVWLTPPGGRRTGMRWSLARQMRRLRRRITGSL